MKKQRNESRRTGRLTLQRETLKAIGGGEVGSVRPWGKVSKNKVLVSVKFKFSIP